MRFYILLFALIFSALNASAEKAKLQRVGNSQQLYVDGRPFIVLGGELGNSSATNVADIDAVFPKLKEMGLNTVLVPVYWELIEPEQDKFDFSLVDRVISKSNDYNMKIIFLWFGIWKNSMSCYAPSWIKTDLLHYIRACTSTEKPLDIVSAFSENALSAEDKSFGNFIGHVKQVDTRNNVIMIQIENEIGMLEEARDHANMVNEIFEQNVPAELISYLTKNKSMLHPYLAQKWESAGGKTEGNWSEIFGSDIYTDEIFMAYHYALYVEKLAKTAKFQYNIPLYVNAALNSRDRKPGEYPSAGPLAHLIDIWRCAAPSIDILAPDIYDDGFEGWLKQYHLPNNPLFVPEMKLADDNGVKAFFAVGEHEALGVSPFSIEQNQNKKLKLAYDKLNELTPLLSKWYGRNAMHGFMFRSADETKSFTDNDMNITVSHINSLPWFTTDSTSAIPTTGGLTIRIADDEYIIAGTGIVVNFDKVGERKPGQLGVDGFAMQSGTTADTEKWGNTDRVGIVSVDEVNVTSNGSMTYLRRLNGDETHQGRHVRIAEGDYKILHVKLYRYK